MLAFFCLGARYRPWRYFAALHSRVFGDGAAPRRTRCSPQPRQHSVFRASGGAFSKSCLRRRFLLRGGRQLFGAGRIQALVHGKIFAKCVLGRLVVTRFRHGAFPGARRWQNARAVRPPQHLAVAGLRPDALLARLAVAIFSRGAFPGVLPWQDSAAVRSRASIRGKFCAPCIPKAASDGKIASSRQDSHATHPK